MSGRAWGALVDLVLVLVLCGLVPVCVRFVAALVRDVYGGRASVVVCDNCGALVEVACVTSCGRFCSSSCAQAYELA